MPTAYELTRTTQLGDRLAHHVAICVGEYCACCDALLPDPPPQVGQRLCRACWPDPAVPWYPLYICIMCNREQGWTLCIGDRTPDQTFGRVGYWLLLHDRAECVAILDRYLCCRLDRERFDALRDDAAHACISIFVNPRRLAALVEATRKDPRTGYDKRRAQGAPSSAPRACPLK